MEEISNFKELVESYYKKSNNDVVFDFMHISLNYTYMHLNKEIYTLHQDGTISISHSDERVRYKKTIFVPFITSKEYYEEKLSDDLYHLKRTLTIQDTIDIGSSNNFNYNELNKKIYEIMPNECHIIDEVELSIIAHQNGYDKFEWEIYDEAVGLPPIAYGGPMWVYKIYGVRGKDYKTCK